MILISKRRVTSLKIFILIVFLIIIGRLIHLQIYHGKEYTLMAESNRIRKVKIQASRGKILDREGEVLADEKPSYNLLYMLSQNALIDDPIIRELANILNISEEEIVKRIKERPSPFLPATLASDLPFNKVAEISERFGDTSALYIQPSLVRHYPNDEVACHILGYIGEVDKETLKKRRNEGLGLGDIVGKAGVEYTYDSYLRGKDGIRFIPITPTEKKVKLYETPPPIEPIPGCDIHLTIDLGLQRFCEETIGDRRGAIIVMDANDGSIYSLASKPTFNPNIFSGYVPADLWITLANDESHPLLNRAISASYPPGSTFKLVTASAALENGLVEPDEHMEVPCYGYFKFGNRIFHCWNPAGHGALTISEAITYSCNVFFFQVGLRVGIERLEEMSKRYHLGEKTGIDLPGEVDGLIPSIERLKRKFGDNYPKGEILNNSIGQGHVMVTPIQMAVLVSSLANGGKLVKPHLIDYITDPEGKIVYMAGREIISETGISEETRKIILDGMEGVLKRTGENRHYMCGKTGSAENPHGKTHSWFVSFCPRDNPRLVVVLLFEHGIHGEFYIHNVKQIIDYCRQNGIPDDHWPLEKE
ncbi:MAG: penicillin-binding protein 2 [Candidatus Coatesbacteria bacterium]|nr:MAG: penicillin-binding protein 2 [Candidatus Coatesbacteria bacterium]